MGNIDGDLYVCKNLRDRHEESPNIVDESHIFKGLGLNFWEVFMTS